MGALRPSFRQCGKITTQKDNFTCLHWNMEFSTEVHNVKAWILCLFLTEIDPTEQAVHIHVVLVLNKSTRLLPSKGKYSCLKLPI